MPHISFEAAIVRYHATSQIDDQDAVRRGFERDWRTGRSRVRSPTGFLRPRGGPLRGLGTACNHGPRTTGLSDFVTGQTGGRPRLKPSPGSPVAPRSGSGGLGVEESAARGSSFVRRRDSRGSCHLGQQALSGARDGDLFSGGAPLVARGRRRAADVWELKAPRRSLLAPRRYGGAKKHWPTLVAADSGGSRDTS